MPIRVWVQVKGVNWAARTLAYVLLGYFPTLASMMLSLSAPTASNPYLGHQVSPHTAYGLEGPQP